MEHFVEGWTKRIEYDLKKGVIPATFNAAGMTVETILRDHTGTEVIEGGTTAWVDQANSRVGFTPLATDLTVARSPMRVRWKVTAGAEVEFFPKGDPEEWVIHQP